MIVLTGATGRTGSAAAEALRAKGEKVRVVGRDAKKLSPLARLAAEAFVGNVEDVSSMTEDPGPQGRTLRHARGHL